MKVVVIEPDDKAQELHRFDRGKVIQRFDEKLHVPRKAFFNLAKMSIHRLVRLCNIASCFTYGAFGNTEHIGSILLFQCFDMLRETLCLSAKHHARGHKFVVNLERKNRTS